ncbi:MAG: SH3 domain-containing protein [Xanthobacteraceae bacterium]|nr:SH3 domain-containing protein [Xanthobacteraceae bacterium]
MNIEKSIVLKMFLSATFLFPFCFSSFAQHACRVADSTKTPLNVRAQPNGQVVATLNNGDEVNVLDRSTDPRGRSWVYIKKVDQDASLGWAFADFIVCSTSESQQQSPTIWNHNGSIVALIAKGTSRQFVYEVPRKGIADQGVEKGTILFTGIVRNGQYYGTARIFRRGCGSFPYQVSGPILDGFRRVIMNGQAPRIDANCRVSGYFTDTLEFTLLDEAIVTATPPNEEKIDIQENTKVEIAAPKSKTTGDQKTVVNHNESTGIVDPSFLYFLLALILLFVVAVLVRLVRNSASSVKLSPSDHITLSKRGIGKTNRLIEKTSTLSRSESGNSLQQKRGEGHTKALTKNNNGASVRKSEQTTDVNYSEVRARALGSNSTIQQDKKSSRQPSLRNEEISAKAAVGVVSNKVVLLVIGAFVLCSIVFVYIVTPRDDCAWVENLDRSRLEQRLALLPLDQRVALQQRIMMLGYEELGETLDSTRKRMEAFERGERYESKNRSFEETKKLACTRFRAIVEPIYNWR